MSWAVIGFVSLCCSRPHLSSVSFFKILLLFVALIHYVAVIMFRFLRAKCHFFFGNNCMPIVNVMFLYCLVYVVHSYYLFFESVNMMTTEFLKSTGRIPHSPDLNLTDNHIWNKLKQLKSTKSRKKLFHSLCKKELKMCALTYHKITSDEPSTNGRQGPIQQMDSNRISPLDKADQSCPSTAKAGCVDPASSPSSCLQGLMIRHRRNFTFTLTVLSLFTSLQSLFIRTLLVFSTFSWVCNNNIVPPYCSLSWKLAISSLPHKMLDLHNQTIPSEVMHSRITEWS